MAILIAVSVTAIGGTTPVQAATRAVGTQAPLAWSTSVAYPPGVDLRGTDLAAVACSAGGHCVAAGNNQQLPPTVLHSADGGAHWDGTLLAAGLGVTTISGISCPSPTECVLVGSGNGGASAVVASGAGPAIRALTLPAQLHGSGNALSGVSCTTPTTCVAVGGENNQAGPAVLIRTTDAGVTWSPPSLPERVGLDTGYLSSISCISTTCVAGGRGGTPTGTRGSCGSGGEYGPVALISTDGGVTWAPSPGARGHGNNCGDFNQVACPTPTQCEIAGLGESGPTLLGTADGGNSWSSASVPAGSNLGGTGSLVGVACSSRTNCVAAGPGPSGTGPPVVLSTADGGTSWATRPASSASSGSFDAVGCAPDGTCAAVGLGDGIGLLSHSTDGGITWEAGAAPGPVGLHGGEFDGISCVNRSNCTAVGSVPDGSGQSFVVGSDDGGTSWHAEPTPGLAALDNPVLASVTCPTTANCVAAGSTSDGPVVVSTSDGGKLWHTDQVPNSVVATGSSLASISCSTASRCVGVGGFSETGTAGGLVITTRDGGLTWRQQSIPAASGLTSSGFLDGVSCPTTSVCVAVGSGVEGKPESPAVIIATRDGGVTWTEQHYPGGLGLETGTLSAVSCPTMSGCVAVGEGSRPVILATSDGGRIWSPVRTRGRSASRVAANAVSCAAPGACVAAGPGGLILSSAPTGWKANRVPPPPGITAPVLSGVSCPSVTRCFAAGGQQGAFVLRAHPRPRSSARVRLRRAKGEADPLTDPKDSVR